MRFREPQPADKWREIHDATKYGFAAPQMHEDDPPINLDENEDCLFLNVFTPNADNRKRPVMVFIHGGAFVVGTGARPRLYGGNLTKYGDVVVVTLNYRLGVLGFLHAEGVPPNLGLKDQISALKWVQDNIHSFGGDPENVTIFGESAGAMSLSFLMVMPDARGLFHKAIAESGSCLLESSQLQSSVKSSKKILERLNIQPGDVKALQELPLETLLEAQKKYGKVATKNFITEGVFFPVADGKTVPKNLVAALQNVNIPLLIGHNSDEIMGFGNDLSTAGAIKRFLGKRSFNRSFQKLGVNKASMKRILDNYRKNSTYPYQEFDAVITDCIFRLPAIRQAEAHSISGSGTYFYQFAYKAPKAGGAVHVFELPFVFGNLDTTDVSELLQLSATEEEKQMSKIVMDSWVAFAHTGNPNHAGIPDWPQYDAHNRATMVLDKECKVINAPLDEERAVWETTNLNKQLPITGFKRIEK